MPTIIGIATISFILNLAWENLQAPLYAGYGNFWQHAPVCFRAALGDIAIILFIYAFFALVYRNRVWIAHLNRQKIALLMILGAAIAITIELGAQNAGRWSYTSAMPLIPLTPVGLLPVLQMILLPTFTYYFSAKLSRS